MEYSEHLPWKSRGYLPHLDILGELQFITYRLADSLPQELLWKLEKEFLSISPEKRDLEKRKNIENFLDQGIGSCPLRHPALAAIVQETFLKFDGDRYQLLEWCIMPNHIHVLIRPHTDLATIIQSWKSFTGRWALQHREKLGIEQNVSRFWMPDYWDRFIRDEAHYNNVVNYIHTNPVKAGLCKTAEGWHWSSAFYRAVP